MDHRDPFYKQSRRWYLCWRRFCKSILYLSLQRSAQSRSSNTKPRTNEKGANWRGKIYAGWLLFCFACGGWISPFGVHILLGFISFCAASFGKTVIVLYKGNSDAFLPNGLPFCAQVWLRDRTVPQNSVFVFPIIRLCNKYCNPPLNRTDFADFA